MCILEPRPPIFLRKFPFNTLHKYFIPVELILITISLVWYIFFEAESFEVIVEIASVIAGMAVGLGCYLAFIQEVKRIIEVQDDLQEIIQQSEYQGSRNTKTLLDVLRLFL